MIKKIGDRDVIILWPSWLQQSPRVYSEN